MEFLFFILYSIVKSPGWSISVLFPGRNVKIRLAQYGSLSTNDFKGTSIQDSSCAPFSERTEEEILVLNVDFKKPCMQQFNSNMLRRRNTLLFKHTGG